MGKEKEDGKKENDHSVCRLSFSLVYHSPWLFTSSAPLIPIDKAAGALCPQRAGVLTLEFFFGNYEIFEDFLDRFEKSSLRNC